MVWLLIHNLFSVKDIKPFFRYLGKKLLSLVMLPVFMMGNRLCILSPLLLNMLLTHSNISFKETDFFFFRKGNTGHNNHSTKRFNRYVMIQEKYTTNIGPP